MDTFKVIAFTHKHLPLELIGKLHLSHDEQSQALIGLKVNFDFEELLYLATCNRIELLIRTERGMDASVIREVARFLNSRLTEDELSALAAGAEYYTGSEAVQHVLKVASSLDSLVVGEREIITQVRKAYDFCNQLGITGDFTRLLIKQTIETAKDIYTNTDIARNSVSVASLAYRQLRQLGIRNDARIVFVGAGETNTILANYFQKHKFANFTVFNRTLANAQKLAELLKGRAFELSQLHDFKEGFDVLVVCASNSESLISPELFSHLISGDNGKKAIIDLGVPANVHPVVAGDKQVHYIDINSLRAQADANMQLRKNEVIRCEEIIKARCDQFYAIHRERRIELAFSEVPRQVRVIRDLAINEVFAKEISSLDNVSKDVLDKVLAYVEKKYNAVAIKTAKEVFLDHKIQRKKDRIS
mgnify:CR=1 FL=1